LDNLVLYSRKALVQDGRFSLYNDRFLCNFVDKLAFSDCIGQKILLIGESNVGKTEITAEFVNFCQNSELIEKIFVLDMGPERFMKNNLRLGGKLQDFSQNLSNHSRTTHLSFDSIPARSNASSLEQVYEHCKINYVNILPDLVSLTSQLSLGCAVVINDISIFLHLGPVKLVHKIISRASTIFLNSYYGDVLSHDYNSNISSREYRLVRNLFRHVDYTIHLIR
jgi:hypothetical protein